MEPKILSDQVLEGGSLKRVEHWSESCQAKMRFSIFLPKSQRLSHIDKYPVLYFLCGMNDSDEKPVFQAAYAKAATKYNLMKMQIARYIKPAFVRYGLAIVFPDSGPRGVDPEDKFEDVGEGKSFYINATQKPWSEHYR